PSRLSLGGDCDSPGSHTSGRSLVRSAPRREASSEDLLNHGLRTLVDLIEDSPDVFPDHTQHRDDQAQEEDEQASNAGEPGDAVASKPGVDHHEDAVAETQQRDAEADDRHRPEWQHGETEHRIEEEVELLPERPARFP